MKGCKKLLSIYMAVFMLITSCIPCQAVTNAFAADIEPILDSYIDEAGWSSSRIYNPPNPRYRDAEGNIVGPDDSVTWSTKHGSFRAFWHDDQQMKYFQDATNNNARYLWDADDSSLGSIIEGGDAFVDISTNLAWALPLNGPARITSFFGYRTDPITGKSGSGHGGTDIGASTGTPIYAIADGTVSNSQFHNSYGNYVKIDHGMDANGNKVETLYAHMSRRVAYAGQKVTQGQLIGYVGSTGRSTGPHLHLEIRINGTRKDVLDYFPSLDWYKT